MFHPTKKAKSSKNDNLESPISTLISSCDVRGFKFSIIYDSIIMASCRGVCFNPNLAIILFNEFGGLFIINKQHEILKTITITIYYDYNKKKKHARAKRKYMLYV